MNREDFPILDSDIIYFDNAATTFKPQIVVDKMSDYYLKYTANAHRGDYDNSLKVDTEYENAREKVRKFINASKKEEIVFTSGATDAINRVVFGFMMDYLKQGDEVVISKSEHASNILPWVVLEEKIGIKIKYVELDDNYEVTLDNLGKIINNKTKVISLAFITNAIGDVRPIKGIGRLCKEKGILFLVDATQSVGHIKSDVVKDNIDFFVFSAHKMLGPTGVGVLYGKYELLEKLVPMSYGGGMNTVFNSSGMMELKDLPDRLEAGTQNIAGVIGLGAAIDYLVSLDLDKVHKHERELKKYLISRIKKVPNIKIYNENIDSGVLIFNVADYFSQDVSIYLNKYKICVRAGNHCAKILKEELCTSNTCRVSLYLYNTKNDVDVLIDALMKQDEILDTLV